MNEVIQTTKVNSYIRTDYETKILERLSVVFLFAYYVLPQYFGIALPGFDLTAQRMVILLFLIVIIDKRSRVYRFVSIIKSISISRYIAAFLIIAALTGLIRTNIGTFMYPLIEFLAFYLLIYIISEVLSVNNTIMLLRKFIWLFCILGIIEYIIMKSPFSYLETIHGLYTGGMTRSGSYRIMGPANHSLAYGLILITAVPLVCVNLEKNELYIFSNTKLLLMVAINIFLTGSRSTLAVFGLEMLLFIIIGNRENKKRTLLYLIAGCGFLSFVVMVFHNSSFGKYILLQITSIIDEVFKTSYAIYYGADVTTLSNSSNYRKLLLDVFKQPWLNPMIGKGSGYIFRWYYNGFYIHSLDNYYVATYVRYAYPGLIIYIILVLHSFKTMIYGIRVKKSGIYTALLIGGFCYFLNLWWLDTLQTIKYLYILFALFFASLLQSGGIDNKGSEN